MLRSSALLWALVVIGIAGRLAVYARDRSLWLDEAAVALNLLRRSTGELFSPLAFGQAAPIGFLVLEKAVARVAGYSEYALRFVPLLASLIALAAFVPVARRMLGRTAAPVAVALLAFADGLMRYSAQLKSYSVDVAATVVLLLIGVLLLERRRSFAFAAAAGVIGVVLVALSYPALLVVPGVAVALAVEAISRRERARPILVVLGVWAAAVVPAGIYAATRLFDIRVGLETQATLGAREVLTLHGLNVFATHPAQAIGMTGLPAWTQVLRLAALVVVVGIVTVIVRAPFRATMLFAPVVLAFVFAAAGKYPLTYRTMLFLVPIVAIALAAGVAQLAALARRRKTPIGIALSVVLLAGPVREFVDTAAKAPGQEELKPVLAHVRDHWQRGDTLYLHYGAQYAFLYYQECHCFSFARRDGSRLWHVKAAPPQRPLFSRAVEPRSGPVMVGPAPRDEQLPDLRRLPRKGRVWFVYTHLHGRADLLLIRGRLLVELRRTRVCQDAIDEAGAHAILCRPR